MLEADGSDALRRRSSEIGGHDSVRTAIRPFRYYSEFGWPYSIPTSCSRVAENNPNLGNLSGFAPPYSLASHCHCHCSTCVAQPIRAMRT
ncbi:unnamed protein product [Cuscuta campestris]|uniref:Uncharacterized protein n=1 Tax=Cuscuta campestris TaxID=132261 RepID=A0A484KJJ4_9ASTE|nr:unnamed protein product [Cuscuta campestris]